MNGYECVYKATATKLREVKGLLTKKALLDIFDKLIKYLKETVNFIDKYASKGVALKAKNLLKVVMDVRNTANRKLGEFIEPVQVFLERFAIRIDKEGDAAFKATTNIRNLTQLRRISADEELVSIIKNKPSWVHRTPENGNLPFKEAKADPKTVNTPLHPSLGTTQLALKSGYDHPLKDAYKTFAQGVIKAQVFNEGEHYTCTCSR